MSLFLWSLSAIASLLLGGFLGREFFPKKIKLPVKDFQKVTKEAYDQQVQRLIKETQELKQANKDLRTQLESIETQEIKSIAQVKTEAEQNVQVFVSDPNVLNAKLDSLLSNGTGDT